MKIESGSDHLFVKRNHTDTDFGSKCPFGGFILVLLIKSIFNNKMIIKNINKNC